MLKLDDALEGAIKVTSATAREDEVRAILSVPGVFIASGHFQYPVSESGKVGNHLTSLFLIEPIARNEQYVEWIAADICLWAQAEKLAFDLIFAPAQPAVKVLARRIAERLRLAEAYWEYTPGGWFGSRLVEGTIKEGDRVLVFNGVTQQGRCVGERLPAFVEAAGGKAVAAAVFAKGTAAGVSAAEKRFGRNFYAMVQVDITVASASDCVVCRDSSHGAEELTPWTRFRDSV